MNWEILSILLFFGIVSMLLFRDRRNLEFKYGIFIRRWYGGEEALHHIAKKELWKWVGNFAILACFLISVWGVYTLTLTTIQRQVGVAPVVPAVTGVRYPRPIIGVPFWYWLLAIFTIVAIHETLHAIHMMRANVPIKSYGLVLLGPFPIGAFVDPDIEGLRKSKWSDKLRVFSMGSFGNIIFAFLVYLLFHATFSALLQPIGVGFMGLVPDTPAAAVNMSGIITSIDHTSIRTLEDLQLVLQRTPIGEEILVMTTDENYTLITVQRPDNRTGSFLGISNPYTFYAAKAPLQAYQGQISWTLGLFAWLFVLHLGVGVFNLLPLKPFDGGYMYEEVFGKVFGRKGKFLSYVTSLFILSLILLNVGFALGLT